eukprot:TRINITY_DN6752_c0_g1_i1.p1 TRINITY_DN6752_c0_g1~~TRINITY_DN6752_c0_g1_i1.p1  ORF type:complete len:364 (+),score=50.37 TRINITY_DN6752_c0_g1_i1:179-1270(+)
MADSATAFLPPSPTKKHRRRRTKLPANLSEAEKDAWRKQNNKLAAQDLRNRRKQYEDDLKSRHDALERENRQLESRTESLEKQQAELQHRLQLFQQCLSAVETEQKDIGNTVNTSKRNEASGSLEPTNAQALAMDTTDDQKKPNSAAMVAPAESAALSPQQSELQRMAPLLMMLLGTILSQPLTTSTSSESITAQEVSSASSTATSQSPSRTKTSTPSINSTPSASGLRRSRRLAKRPSEAVHRPSRSQSPPRPAPQRTATPPTTSSSKLGNSALSPILSGLSLNPAAQDSCPTSTSTSTPQTSVAAGHSTSTKEVSQLLALTLQTHLHSIVEQAARNTVKQEAEDISQDPLQSLQLLLSAAA